MQAITGLTQQNYYLEPALCGIADVRAFAFLGRPSGTGRSKIREKGIDEPGRKCV
jgi:hypothetical protein